MEDFLTLVTADHLTHQLSPGIMMSRLPDEFYASVQTFPGGRRSIVCKAKGATAEECLTALYAEYTIYRATL